MEIKEVVDAVASQIETKSIEFDSKVNAVKTDVELKLNEKSVEIDNLKGQITAITDRANEMDALIAKGKANEPIKVKSFGEKLSDAVSEVGGGNYEKGVKEIEQSLKSAGGSFSISINTKTVGDMTTAASLTGDPVRSYNSRQGLVPFQKINFRDIMPSVMSATGTFVTYRETGSEGSISSQTEGSAKSQIDYDLTEVVTVNTYIAGFARFSKQLMKNLPFLEGTLSRMLLRDFYKAENSAFFTTVSGAATGSTTTISTTSDVEAIIDLIGNQLAANFNPSYALVNPKQLSKLVKETFTSGYYAGAGAVVLTPNGINIFGVPCIPCAWVTDNYVLIVDADYLERVEAEAMNIVFSYEDGTNFTQNKVTARIECLEAVNTLRVDSLIYKSLAAIS
jgi:hypothetical protein